MIQKSPVRNVLPAMATDRPVPASATGTPGEKAISGCEVVSDPRFQTRR